MIDGVVDVEAWQRNGEGKRILLVLRDKNGGTRPAYHNDFRRELAETGSGWKTWNNAARWGQVLLEPEIQYESVKYLDSRSRSRLLHPLAVMNLKKDYGGNYTNRADLDRIVDSPERCRLLRRQVELYGPDRIIACGMPTRGHKSNMELVIGIFGKESEEIQEIQVNGRTYRYFILPLADKRVPVIEFYHPQVTRAAAFGEKRGHELWREMFEDIRKLAFFASMRYNNQQLTVGKEERRIT